MNKSEAVVHSQNVYFTREYKSQYVKVWVVKDGPVRRYRGCGFMQITKSRISMDTYSIQITITAFRELFGFTLKQGKKLRGTLIFSENRK